MKSEVFNGSRFWTYFKYDLMQMWRNHVKAAIGIGLAGLAGYFVAVIFNLIIDAEWQGPSLVYRFIVFSLAALAFELYQTRTYGYLTEKRRGSAWLMMPASTFEKWLSMMLITLILLPVLFLASSALVDAVLCLADPTMEKSMLTVLSGGFKELSEGLLEINDEYMTNWSVGVLGWPFVVSLWTNLLFWLLCGVCFKRNKILGGFVIMLGLSIALSSFTSINMRGEMIGYHDVASAEAGIRSLMNWFTAIEAIVAAGLAGGIFWRLKNLKH